MKDMLMNILDGEVESIKSTIDDDLDEGRAELINQIRQAKTVVAAFPEDLDVDFDAMIEEAEDAEEKETLKNLADTLREQLADKVGQ